MAVNVVLLSPQLNLTDNTTCQLVNSGLNINFYTIDIKSSTYGTPLGVCSLITYIKNCQYQVTCCNYIVEGFFTSPKLKESPHQIVHKADALRLLLIHKFGGFYLDLDYVVLNDLSHYNNILVGNSKYNNNMNNSLAAYLDVLFNLYLEQTQSQ